MFSAVFSLASWFSFCFLGLILLPLVVVCLFLLCFFLSELDRPSLSRSVWILFHLLICLSVASFFFYTSFPFLSNSPLFFFFWQIFRLLTHNSYEMVCLSLLFVITFISSFFLSTLCFFVLSVGTFSSCIVEAWFGSCRTLSQ